MSYELICSCLQLSPDQWPPDHYTLLGLAPGETDARRIEQHVQERMEKLRRYQLTHTDQVTEGMNRLAQALVCLTDPLTKQAYDAKLPKKGTVPLRIGGLSPFSAGQVKRPTRSSGFRSSRRTTLHRPVAGLSRSWDFPRWLLFAWIVWLSIGVAGLAAVIWHFPAIKGSYLGVTEKIQSSPPVQIRR